MKAFVPELKKVLDDNGSWVFSEFAPEGVPVIHTGELVTVIGSTSRPGHADHKYPPVTDNSDVCHYSSEVTRTYLPYGRIK